MSGLKIAIPTVQAVTGTAAVGILSLPVVLGVAAVAVAAILAADYARAERLRELEEKRRREIEELHRRKLELEKARHRAREAVDRAAGEFKDLMEAARSMEESSRGEMRLERKSAGSTVEGFMDLGPQGPAKAAKVRAVINSLQGLLDTLPAEFKADEAWPYARFEAQVKAYLRQTDEGLPPSTGQVQAFQQTLARTIDRFYREAQTGAEARTKLFEEADRLMSEVLASRYLAVRPEHKAELESIRDRLPAFMKADALDWGDLDVMGKRTAVLREEVENTRQWRAYRRTLAESLTRNLEEIGYGALKTFDKGEEPEWLGAIMAVPGGERLNVDLSADGRMNFRMVHERRETHSAMTAEEIDFYRRQEDRWSRDFRELIRRLTREGFSYQVQTEDLADADAIPIVVVETADELLAEEQAGETHGEEPRHRRR